MVPVHHCNDGFERNGCRCTPVLDGFLVFEHGRSLDGLGDFGDFVLDKFGHVHVTHVMALRAVDFADLGCRERLVARDEYRDGCGIAADNFLGLFEVRGLLVHGNDWRARDGNPLFARDAYPRVLFVCG